MLRRSNRLNKTKPTTSNVKDFNYFHKVCATWRVKYDSAKIEVDLLNDQIARCQAEIDKINREQKHLMHDRDSAADVIDKVHAIIATAQLNSYRDSFNAICEIAKVLDEY